MKSTCLLLLATIASAAAFVAPSRPRAAVVLSAETSRRFRRWTRSSDKMKYLLPCVALFQPCNSLIDHAVPSSPQLQFRIFGLAIVALLFAACYLFYPAYINVRGGLGFSGTLLAGGGESDKGKSEIQVTTSCFSF